MTYIGSQGAGRRLNCRHVGIGRRSPRFAHRFIPALWGLTLLLSIALTEVIGSDALANSCDGWEGDEARAFWATATVETISPCLDSADFGELEFGDASKPLMMAARFSSDPAVVDALIAAGAIVGPDEPEQGKFDIALHEAARDNKNSAIIGVLLKHGRRFLNSHDAGGGAPLHYAAASGNLGAAEALIAARADVNLGERWFHATPLQYAADRDDNVEMIELFVRAGADVNKADCNGDTPLHRAAKRARTTTTLEALLRAGADVNMRNERRGRIPCRAIGGPSLGATPLLAAAQHNESVTVVKALIAAGADPNLVGGDLLLTPLQEAAAHNNNPAVARALLDAGANVDARVLPADKGGRETFPSGRYVGNSGHIVNGMTVMHLATMANSESGVVDALLSSGADVAAKDARGRTPLHLAAMTTSEAAVVDALVAVGADVEAKDLWGRTPLHYALEANDNPDVAAALVRGGANVNARSPDYPAATLLHKVAQSGKKPTVVSMFVAGGADVNAMDDAEATPLHYAATFNENPDMIAALVAAGADVNARMRNRCDLDKGVGMGETPLHRAVRYNSAASVTKALLDAGASPRAVDEHGDTSLDLVRYSSDDVRVLLEAWESEHPLENSGVLPAGTLVYVPGWVLEEFELVRRKWGQARTYLMAKYSITAPSVWDERKETSYIPLARRIGTREETVMVDVTNIRSIDIGNKNVFVTVRETVALEVTDGIRRQMSVNQHRE